MNYRQWKKKYKKLHGVNPPLQLDRRKQRRLAKKAIKNIRTVSIVEVANRAAEAITNAAAAFMRGLGGAFDSAGTVCRNVADNIQPLEIKGRAEIIESDHIEYIRRTSPERIKRRNDAADSLRAAVITAYESGVFNT